MSANAYAYAYALVQTILYNCKIRLNARVLLQISKISNISTALSKTAGLFKIPIGGRRRSQGDEFCLEIPVKKPS